MPQDAHRKKHNMCPTLKVHGTIMPEFTDDVYLGDILSSDGKNTKNIKQRISKGLGVINQIFNILGNVNFGSHFFEIAMLLRESMFILTNTEILYNMQKNEVEDFENLDRLLFRRLLEVPLTTPGESSTSGLVGKWLYDHYLKLMNNCVR